MDNWLPGVAPLVQGGERPARNRPGDPPMTQLLWRPQTFLVTVPSTGNIPLFGERSLVVGLQLYADNINGGPIYIGSKLLNAALSPPGNTYFALDPGRSAWIYTDKPETESFDVAMYFAAQLAPASDCYLHCTQWQAQAL